MQSESAVQGAVLQAEAEAQTIAFWQGLPVEVQACVVPSQTLVVRVAPEHEGPPQEVPAPT
jgi:hypothetical protein